MQTYLPCLLVHIRQTQIPHTSQTININRCLWGKQTMLFIPKVLEMDWQYFIWAEGAMPFIPKVLEMGWQYFCLGRGPCCSFQKCWKWTDNILFGQRGHAIHSKSAGNGLTIFLSGEGTMLFIPKVLEIDWQYFVRGGGHAIIPKVLEMDWQYFVGGKRGAMLFIPKVLEMDWQYFVGKRGCHLFGSKQVFQPVQISRHWAQGPCLSAGNNITHTSSRSRIWSRGAQLVRGAQLWNGKDLCLILYRIVPNSAKCML